MPKEPTPPAKFATGWLEQLDGRTGIAQAMRERHRAFTDDLGGITRLSYAQRSLVERALWLEFWLQTQEQALASGGTVTGASARNWKAYGHEVQLPTGFAAGDQALLSDPQTSGGLLVSCTPEAVAAVLEVFKRHGFDNAAAVGTVLPPETGDGVALRVV